MVFGPGSKDHKSINSILPEGLLSNLEYSSVVSLGGVGRGSLKWRTTTDCMYSYKPEVLCGHSDCNMHIAQTRK